MILQIWTLKRGRIDPPEPLEDSLEIEQLWWEQDHPIQANRVSYWRERCNYEPVRVNEP